MISLARSGPESMSLTISRHAVKARQTLSEWGTRVALDAEEALGKYGSSRALIFLTAADESGNVFHEAYVSETPLEHFMASLINDGLAAFARVSLMPGYILMRLLGDFAKGVEALRRDIGGEIIDASPRYRPDISGASSIIYFTPRSLAKTVPAEGIYEKALLVHTRSKSAILQYLSVRGMEYLNEALGTPDWNDFEIKLYDADGFFEEQRERLLTVVQGLQAGLVLEEKWDREQALALRSVTVYTMKLFTPLDDSTVKKIAMGLEYNHRGERFADFDVYKGRRKISAFTEIDKNRGKTRAEIGMANRNVIFKNIDVDSIDEMQRLEAKIEKLKSEDAGRIASK